MADETKPKKAKKEEGAAPADAPAGEVKAEAKAEAKTEGLLSFDEDAGLAAEFDRQGPDEEAF